MYHPKAVASLMVLLIAGLCSAPGVWASAPDALSFNTRVGTIAYSRSLADGSHVILDCEDIAKIKAKGADSYILVAEPFSRADRLVVITTPSHLLRLGQVIDIYGTLTTLADGQTRALTDVTIKGYTDQAGTLLYHGPMIKGPFSATQWPWMVDLTVNTESAASVTALATPSVTSSGEPNENPAPGPQFYPNISSIVFTSNAQTQSVHIQDYYPGVPQVTGLSDGSLVELLDKRVAGVGTQTVNGTNYNYVDVQEDAPATDTIRAYYTGTVATTDRIASITGQIRHIDANTPVLDVNTGPAGYDPQILVGAVTTAAQGTIAWAKTLADSASVTLGTTSQGKIVTCALSPDCFYIEEDSRMAGIRVEKTGHGRLADDRAYIVGTMGTKSSGERYIVATTADHSGDGLLTPMGMPNRSLGGGDFFYESTSTKGQCGITGAKGLNNLGLLVKSWGKITAIDSASPATWFTIDDGSGVNVKVDLQTSTGNVIASSLQTGGYVWVTGISSCEVSGTDLVPVLRPGPMTPPSFDPPAGVQCACLGVTVKSAMLGDRIQYTTNGSDPDASSTVYDPAGVAVIIPTQTLKARVYRDPWVAAGTVGSALYYTNSSCTGSTTSPTCYEFVDTDPPSITGLRLSDIAPGSMSLKWGNYVWDDSFVGADLQCSNGFEIERDTTHLANAPDMQYTDNFAFDTGTSYHYKVRALSGHGNTYGLPAHTSETSGIVPVPFWSQDGAWEEISVVPQKVMVSQDQAVDSRTDTRHVEDKLVDFPFGTGTYRGGLYVGNAGDPSKLGRSFLKFDLTGLQGQMGTNDRLWTGSLQAYYTRSFADGMSTNVGCQFVANDTWDGSVVWSTAPAINPVNAKEYVTVTGGTPCWYHWNSAFPYLAQELYGNHALSLGLASMQESSPGWAYFAKKEYDNSLGPNILCAYGKYEDSGSGTPPIFVAGIDLSSLAITGGRAVRGTVRLNSPAPAGGHGVGLFVDSCLVSLPSIVYVPEGALTTDFTVSTAVVTSTTNVTISAFAASATLTVNP